MIKTFMLPSEFAEAFSQGLAAILETQFPKGREAHIEDMLVSATMYTEHAFQFLSSMPVESRIPVDTKKKDTKKKKEK